ncbi:hypothetical protein [Klebsiella pneumoniae]|uniref:hypothetical protein n=1 Tax=Klebsiella pneumoniae TaxID=573 RepID=UPI00200E4797|nr:hypothetical protein [Klebsiella pneumoniae]UPY99804.1 hypothetical protein MOV22_26820 [Klebsiella pneumoniae]
MKLDDPSLLDGRVAFLHVPAGTLVSKQGDQDVNILFVVSGMLHVYQQKIDSLEDTCLFLTHPGPSVVRKLDFLEGTIHHRCGREVRSRLSDLRVAGGHD